MHGGLMHRWILYHPWRVSPTHSGICHIFMNHLPLLNCRSLLSHLFRDTRKFYSSTGAFQTLIISHYQPNREPKLYRTCCREAKNKSVCLRDQKNKVKKKTWELSSIMASTKLDRRKDREIYG